MVGQLWIQRMDHDASKEEAAGAVVDEDCVGAGRTARPKTEIDTVDEPTSGQMTMVRRRIEYANHLD